MKHMNINNHAFQDNVNDNYRYKDGAFVDQRKENCKEKINKKNSFVFSKTMVEKC